MENIEGKNFLSLFPIWKISKGKISFPSFLYGKYRRFSLSPKREKVDNFPSGEKDGKNR
jgi:hypothetical protein